MADAFAGKFHAAFGRPPEIIARAPGRIEFIGNHTDYNGGTVLGAAIDRSVWVGLSRRSDGKRTFESGQLGERATLAAGDPVRQTGALAWMNYPLGVLAALKELGLRSPEGFDYLADSNLPIGAGLSSSAAIELASALAYLKSAGEHSSREMLVRAARHAENHFVGVPCGILDQAVSAFGRKNHLVFIDCRGPRFETVPIPSGAHFWVFNTHTRHALTDGLYAERYAECMAAARGFGVSCLAEITAGELAAAETRLAPALFRRARHVVEETARVGAATAALRSGDLAAAGRLLNASHLSSRTLFENSTAELDFLADSLSAEPGVFGARLTGGGFGGAAMALTDAGFGEEAARKVADAYLRRFGIAPDVFHLRTADGASLVEQAKS